MNVLFICNGNVARSQEAEAFLNALSKHKATSAGVDVIVGKSIDPFVIEVMKELEIDLSQARRKLLTEDMVAESGIVVSFKSANEIPSFARNGKNFQYWEVDDPRHQTIEFHHEVRDLVRSKVVNLIESIDNTQ